MVERATLPDGYYDLPPGKLANAVIWFEMRAAPVSRLAPPLRLAVVGDADLDLCNRVFRDVGTPWLWSRAFAPAKAIDGNSYIAFDDAGACVGVAEFEGLSGPAVEIAYFGLVPSATGAGLGLRMMAAVLDLAWAGSPERVWLHTCNYDHPAAMRFYHRCGFTPYASGFEIQDDPRLDGSAPRTVAGHIPLIAR